MFLAGSCYAITLSIVRTGQVAWCLSEGIIIPFQEYPWDLGRVRGGFVFGPSLAFCWGTDLLFLGEANLVPLLGSLFGTPSALLFGNLFGILFGIFFGSLFAVLLSSVVWFCGFAACPH